MMVADLVEEPCLTPSLCPTVGLVNKSTSNSADGSYGKITEQSPLGVVIQAIKFHSLLLRGTLHLQIAEQKPFVCCPWFCKEGNAQDLGRGGYCFRVPRLVAVLGRKHQFPEHQPSALTQPHRSKRGLEASAAKIL